MSPVHRLAGSALLLASLGLLTGAALQADAQTAPLEVTTDTPAYCQHLSDQVGRRVRAVQTPPQEVVRLTDEGDRLCDEGQVRGGIQRLRRALLLMTNPDHQNSAR